MGRTTPSITIAFNQERDGHAGLRRALRRSDQLELDSLFAEAHRHLAAAAYAAYPLPLVTFLLSMLLEEHKELIRLRAVLATLLAEQPEVKNRNEEKIDHD